MSMEPDFLVATRLKVELGPALYLGANIPSLCVITNVCFNL